MLNCFHSTYLCMHYLYYLCMHSHQSTKVWTNIRVLSQKEVHADVKLELPLTLGAPAAQTPVLV